MVRDECLARADGRRAYIASDGGRRACIASADGEQHAIAQLGARRHLRHRLGQARRHAPERSHLGRADVAAREVRLERAPLVRFQRAKHVRRGENDQIVVRAAHAPAPCARPVVSECSAAATCPCGCVS